MHDRDDMSKTGDIKHSSLSTSDTVSDDEASRNQGKAHTAYRFGSFELDPLRETLKGPEGPVPLRDHALRVLKLLIERAPDVVSRDDILDGVWGHQALSESSIAQVIREIRACLGDSARSPELIATRYGRGYQFVGEVEHVDAERAPTSIPDAPETSTDPAEHGSVRTFLIRALAGTAVIVAAMFGWQVFQGEPTIPVADARQTITLRAVASDDGESLSAPFVNYLAFVLGSALGADRVEVERDEQDVETAAQLVEVSLASLNSGDQRSLELAMGRAAIDNPEMRTRFDEASELVRRSLDEILASLEHGPDAEIRFDAALVSRSSFAIETVLRGMSAQLAGDVGRAAELFEAALAEDPDFEFARYELAIALRRNRDFERALAILEPMRQRLTGAGWTVRINNAMGITLWRLERYEEALDALRRAESSATSPRLRSTLLGNIGLLERDQGRLNQAEATLRESLILAEQASSPRLQAQNHNSLASVLIRLDRVDEALVELASARELFYQVGNLHGYGAVLSRTARIHAARGERTETETLLRLALGIREQIGDDDGAADIQLRLAGLHHLRGEFDQARELGRSALEKARALNEDSVVISGYRLLADIALSDGRHAPALSYGNEAMRLAELTGRKGDQREARLGLLELDLATSPSPGDLEVSLTELIRDADAAQDRTVSIGARVLTGRLYRSQQRSDDARRILDRAEAFLNSGDLELRYDLDAERAQLAMLTNDFEAAASALNELERNNAPAHPTLMLRARLQAATGDLRSAVESAGMAKATTGDWWRPEHQAALDAWSTELRR